ncbi:MAG: hypothetical protein ACYDAD_11160 [Acidimicrobiales bacterium]
MAPYAPPKASHDGTVAVAGYVYVSSLQLYVPLGGSDNLDGSASLNVSGVGVAPAGTSLKLVDGTTPGQFAAVDAAGDLQVDVGNFLTLQGASTGTLEAIRALLAGVLTTSTALLPSANTIGAVTQPDIETRFYRLLNQMVPDGQEMRSCILQATDPSSGVAADATSIYLGIAVDGTAATATSWSVLRIQGFSGQLGRWRTVAGVAWTAAVAGANPPWS